MTHLFHFALVGRRRVLLGALCLASPGMAAAKPCAPPSVLFVCPAGTVKSAIARETLRARAASAGVAVAVQSRGLHVEDHVSPTLAAALRADGVNPAAEPARPLQDADVDRADIVIAFDEAAQAPQLRHARVWDIPSWNSDYRGAKAALAMRIDDLLVELRDKTRKC
jgi:protein-tyrosine-phosphatase